ncbi:MAG: hypothetical protein HEQ38_17315 [Gemmatimonas sp.]|nr:hypothetical protein [Gemmatimonas sp.]
MDLNRDCVNVRWRGMVVHFAAHERERVVSAWRDGVKWFEGDGPFGELVTCDLSEVIAVEYVPVSASHAHIKDRSFMNRLWNKAEEWGEEK